MRNIAKLNPTNKVFGYIVYVLIALAFTCAAFTGCGTDEITGSNGNPPASEQLIYSLDSLGTFLPNGLYTKDTLFDIQNAPYSKITFDCETNADSANANALFRISSEFIDTNNVIITYMDTVVNNEALMNNHFTFFINGGNSYPIGIYIQLINVNQFQCYLRLKNIKIYKLSY